MTLRALRWIEWALLIASTSDLIVRQLTRRSTMMWLGAESAWAPWMVAALAVIAGAVILVTHVGARPASPSAGPARAGPYVRQVKRTIALFLTLFAIGTAAQLHLGARLQSDGFYYYAYARSIWFDGDVNLANDYRALGLDDAQHRHLFVPTVTGHAQTTWAIGPAVLWSPFIGVGHLAARILQRTGTDVATDGTSFPYRQAVCLAGLFYGLVGLFFCYHLARTTFGARVSVASVAVVALGSFVVWYLVREPTMSHAVSMASVAAFCWYWASPVRSRGAASGRRGVRGWMLLGALAGLAALVRWQNVLFALLPLLPYVGRTDRKVRQPDADFKFNPRYVLAYVAAAAIVFVPQMLAWQAIYGQPLATSPIAPIMSWTRPQIADLLWSARNGLFATSPALYVAAVGIFLLWKWNRILSIAGLLMLAAMSWTNGAVEDWWGGAGFGGRRFDSLIPLLVCGMAAFATSLSRFAARRPAVVVAAAIGLIVIWNVTLMAVARAGVYRIGQPVSFGDLAAAQAGVLHDWAGHVPSYPANLVYAMRNGVPPAAYDLLRPYRFLGDPARQYGRVDIGPGDTVYVGDGWHLPEHDADTGFRWSTAAAEVRVPLDHAADLVLQIRLRPYDDPGAAPQQFAVVVNRSRLSPVTLTNDWQVVEWNVRAEMWRAGVNRLSLQFARETRPSQVGGGGDERALAAAIDYVRVAVPTGVLPAGAGR